MNSFNKHKLFIFSFSFDICKLYFILLKASCSIVGISGVFRELPENLLDPERYYGFRRLFTIATHEDGYCQIINEQLHIFNALSFQTISSFKVARPIITDDMLLPQTEKDHQQVVDTLKIITNLNTAWAKK